MNFRRKRFLALFWAGLGLMLLLSLDRILADPTVPASTNQSPVIISEFFTDNRGGLPDEDGDAVNWIELYNRNGRAVELEGWSLTDDPARPDKWLFDRLTIEPGEYLVVFASGKDRFFAGTEQEPARLHTNFRLSSDAGYLALHPPTSRRHLDASVFHYPVQVREASFGSVLDGRGHIVAQGRHFGNPTPGAANDASSAWAGLLPPLHIDVQHGYYAQPFDVTITSEVQDAVIRYTLDGSEPTQSHGLTYDAPIRIAQTTPLRAAAIKPDHQRSPIATQTYIFVEDVVRQAGIPDGFPATWGTHSIDFGGYQAGTPVEAIYDMDTRIVDDPRFGPMLPDALMSIPTVSLVMPMEHFEIYSRPHDRGREHEFGVSVEFFDPAGEPEGFQIDAGVRIQGGAGRWWFMPKKSFRLFFRQDYGASQLNYPVFPDSPVSEFNTLVLRAGSDRSFVGHPPAPDRQDVDHRLATYARDEWGRASQIAMSGYGSHGTFVHLYINGIYWGLYNLVERPDTAFAAAYLGGDRDDWFTASQGGMVRGMPDRFLVLMQLAEAGDLDDPERYATMLEFIDPIQFSDYMILQWYMGNRDWPENNWYVNVQYPAGRNLFFIWDAEDTWHNGAKIILGGPGAEGAPFPNVIKLVFEALWENPDFRMIFADRLYHQLMHDGALTDENSQARWLEITAGIEAAIVAESARWGYVRYDTPITLDDWRRARDLVLAQMEGNAAKLLELARAAGYYPEIDPPQLSWQGGAFGDELALAMRLVGPDALEIDGAIYYTLDGTDPRRSVSDGAENGEIATGARLYDEPIQLTTATVVKARAWIDGEWSALNEATFYRDDQQGDVRISEIMYNPVGGGEYEFLEIRNVGEVGVDLSGAYFEGIQFHFPEYTMIEAGQAMVLVRDFQTFRSRYAEAPIHGVYEGRLSNAGETIGLYARSGELIDAVTYEVDERWPWSANGEGDSLVLWDLAGDPNHPRSWQASSVMHGSPGAVDPALE